MDEATFEEWRQRQAKAAVEKPRVKEAQQRLRRALATMSDVNQWLGKHDGHVEAVKLGQAMRDVRWVLVGLEGGQDDE